MQNITGTLMSEDRVIATVKNGVLTDADERLLPLYLKRTGNIEGWLASRAIDSHRTNSRLLKRALRLRTTDDIATALAVNAATVTDRYWFKPEGSSAVYEDIRFKENYFAELALRGDPDSFSRKPSRTPELTNTGSFEKCWKLIDGEWWMYKSGNKEEYFSELFICKLCEKLGLPTAHYELDGRYRPSYRWSFIIVTQPVPGLRILGLYGVNSTGAVSFLSSRFSVGIRASVPPILRSIYTAACRCMVSVIWL